MKNFKLMQDHDVQDIRAVARKAGGGRIDEPAKVNILGCIQKVVATGRARCRGCGEKILKGEPALKFGFDLTELGWGSHTPTTCQIHYKEC